MQAKGILGGDNKSANGILNPYKFLEMGIDKDEMTESRDSDEVFDLLQSAGWKISDSQKQDIKQYINDHFQGIMSINNCRNAFHTLYANN